MATITTAQLKGQIRGILKKYPDAGIVGLKSKNQWPDATTIEIDGSSFFVTQCNSQLSIREAFINVNSQKTGLVFVTDLEDLDLSNDVRAVLVRRKLIKIKPWSSVKNLFQANAIDGSVYQKQWLAEVLLSMAPAEGYKVAPSGFLSAERIWEEILFLLLNIQTSRPDAMDILEWSINKKLVSVLNELTDSQFHDICQWIEPHPNSLEVFLLTLLRKRVNINLIALGLTLEVTTSDFANGNDTLRDAAIRLEKYTDNQPTPDNLKQKWIDAAYGVYQNFVEKKNKDIISEIQERLDYILKEIGIIDYAWLSSVSHLGFEQRLIYFAKGINKHLRSKKAAEFKSLGQLLTSSEKHLSAARFPKRVERMRMAFRLLKWLSDDHSQRQDDPKTFFDAANGYLKDGGYVDRARDALRIGDERQELSQAYMKVMKQVGSIRETQNKHFAENLKKWTASGSEGDNLIKVEDFLDKIIAPIAKKHRLLFIVLDGMNMSVFSELKADLIWNDTWVEILPDEGDSIKPVIAALPTVTEISRKSLLCGKLTANSKDDETKGFANHDRLREATGTITPKLFLKGDISSIESTDLAETVRKEIYSTRRKVIGTVVNAVDDFLYRNDQMSIAWGIEKIPILSQLLYAAREAGRIVIISSDHGHVLDYHTKLSNYESGERWRPDDGTIDDGEIAIHGERVLKPKNGKMIAPYNEIIRYGKKKNGYHGGVTPQEVVIPYTIIKWQQIEKGWIEVPFYQPEWWDIRIEEEQLNPDAPVYKKPKPKKVHKNGQYLMFNEEETADSVSTSEWMYDLLKSEVLQNQKKLCGRAVLSDEMIYKFIKTVSSHGGTILQSTLAQSIEQPLTRIRGIISVIQRILNVDGYPVLTFDSASSTIKINNQLLKTQFRL